MILAATPIGNLEDVSPRLARVLREADHVFAEDTRHSIRLLDHLGIDRKLHSFHDHSPAGLLDRIEALMRDETVVYISDAGTPAINDPGFELVRRAHQSGVIVDAVPGPCAAVNALVLSGLPTHAFCFLGFFPTTREKKKEMATRLVHLQMTTVFFEAPSRIEHTLSFLADELPDTEIALCREMTKRHQEVLRGTPRHVIDTLSTAKGEMVLVIEPVKARPQSGDMETRYRQLLEEGNTPARAAKQIAREYDLNKRDVYRRFLDQD